MRLRAANIAAAPPEPSDEEEETPEVAEGAEGRGKLYTLPPLAPAPLTEKERGTEAASTWLGMLRWRWYSAARSEGWRCPAAFSSAAALAFALLALRPR